MLSCEKCITNNGYEFGYYKKSNMIDKPVALFHIPYGTDDLSIYKTLSQMQKIYPDVFYENRKLYEVYGTFKNAIWNSRSLVFNCNTPTTKPGFINFRNTIESYGLKFNITCNNHLITEKHLNDNYQNIILDSFHNSKHSVTVSSDLLFNYLKNKYPKYTYYRSVIASEKENYIEFNPDYDIMLMPRKFNNNWEHLQNIPIENRKRYELLCDDICTPFCDRTVHYNQTAQAMLNQDPSLVTINTSNYCGVHKYFENFNLYNWPLTINPTDIDKYLENGYQHFKLCGRMTHPILIAYRAIRYLIKPEYWQDALCWCISKAPK